MDLDLGKRTVFKVKLDDKSFELRKPSVGEIGQFNSQLKNNKDDSELTLTKKWISGLGLPLDVIDSLEMEMFNKLLDAISGVKKS